MPEPGSVNRLLRELYACADATAAKAIETELAFAISGRFSEINGIHPSARAAYWTQIFCRLLGAAATPDQPCKETAPACLRSILRLV